MQTRDGWPSGNCLMASLASILEVPLDTLPDLYDEGCRRGDPEAWWWGIFLETAREHGYGIEEGEPGGWRFPTPPQGYCIASLATEPRHAVVALDGELVHDPHPLQIGRGQKVEHWYALTPWTV